MTDLLFLSGTTLGTRPSADFHTKWFNRRDFAKGRAFCSKNRNFFQTPDPQTGQFWQIFGQKISAKNRPL